MIREIKFRAWCEEDKVMITDLNSVRLQHGVLKDDMYKLLQYTGLKDKNGVEIYEGDIISYSYFYIGDTEFPKGRAVVKFEDGMYGLWDKTHYLQSLDESSITNYNYEVIGNIYENTELLNG